MNRSEYIANLMLNEKTDMDRFVENNRRIRAAIAKQRAEKARKEGKRNWWRIS